MEVCSNLAKEICACIPDIDEGMLPVFKYSPGVLLNRYILDFYEHKQLKLLEEVNRLNTGDSYDLTNNFRLLLRAISAILNDITEKKRSTKKINCGACLGVRIEIAIRRTEAILVPEIVSFIRY